jgi:two-component system sensor histidine kinase HydH
MKNYTENILQSVKGGVITFDLDSRITKINSSAITSLAAENASILETEEHVRGTELWDLVREGLRSGETVTGREIRMMTLAGYLIPIDVSTSLLREGGQPIGLVVSFRDLSRLKVLEEQIRRADRLASLGHLSAGVAHEIRNPLGIIKGSASILHRRFGGKEGEEGLTESIVAEVDRLSDVVTNLLDFARPKPPNIVEANLNAVVGKALQLAQLHRGGRIEIRNELSPDLPLIPIDPEQCEQVFLNLVLNALEAMEAGGTLTVASDYDPAEDEAVVTVSDTGVGIDPESREKIFDPFFTGKSQGTGLGLSVTHMIVEAHNGRIEVESEVGKGSTFRVRFPMNQREV